MDIASHRRRRKKGEVNIVPMIDVLTVLIFFFLLTMQFKDVYAADINPPSMESAERVVKEKPVFISVTKDGKYYIGQQEIPLEKLGEDLKILVKENPNSSFILVLDKSSQVEHYINVLDKARLANIKKISIQAEKK